MRRSSVCGLRCHDSSKQELASAVAHCLCSAIKQSAHSLRHTASQVEDYDLAKSLKLQIDRMRWVLIGAAHARLARQCLRPACQQAMHAAGGFLLCCCLIMRS